MMFGVIVDFLNDMIFGYVGGEPLGCYVRVVVVIIREFY